MPGPAERRLLRLPLVPRDGARVVRGRRDRGVPQRALRQRQGRPRGAARRRRDLHAGDHRDDRPRRLADDRACSTTTATRSSPAPTSPTGRAAACRRSARCWRRCTRPGQHRPDDVRRVAADLRDHLQPLGDRRYVRADRHRGPRRGRRPAVDRASTTVHGGFGGAPKFPPSMVLEALLRHAWRTGSPGGAGDGRRDLRGDGPRRDLRPAGRRLRALRGRPARGWCRTSRRCSTTTRCCSASTPGGARRWVSGSPRRRPTSWSASWAPPRAASRPRSTPTPRARRAASTSGRRPSWPTRSARTTVRGRPTRSR